MAILRSQRMTTETVPGNDNPSSQLMAIESDSVLEAASPRRSEDVEPLRLVGASDLGDIPEDRWSPFSGFHAVEDNSNVENGNLMDQVDKLAFSDIVSDLGESGSDEQAEEALGHLMRDPKPSSAKLKITLPPLSKAAMSKQTKKSQRGGSPSTLTRERKSLSHKAAQAVKAKIKAGLLSAKARVGKTASPGALSKRPSGSGPTSKVSGRKRTIEKPDFEGAIRALSRSWDDSDECEVVAKKPRKAKANPSQGAKDAGELTIWSVSTYIQIDLPPHTVQKTPRSQKKIEQQDPLWAGPITITHNTTWDNLLNEIAAAMRTRKENLPVHTLSWKFAPGADGRSHGPNDKARLPMTNAAGFKALIDGGIRATRGARNLIICVAQSQPLDNDSHPPASHAWATEKSDHLELAAPSSKRARQDKSNHDADQGSDTGDSDVSDGVKRKKGKGKSKSKSSKKGLDIVLTPIIEKLKEKHRIGQCPVHPGIRCYFYEKKRWHFELDRNRLQVWAHAIDQGEDGVSYRKPPINNVFFSEQQTLKVPRALDAHRNDSNVPAPYLAMSPYAAGPSTPYPQGMMHPGSPGMHHFPFYYSPVPAPSYPMMAPMHMYPPPMPQHGIPHGYQPQPGPSHSGVPSSSAGSDSD
ncbi:hypothetical protein ONZ51_g11396 [Trametes cubensis]|uniref:Uncharacterized protein n=1 Tax=Trametes cubensis TaxID=1111947 RepID=A0AAD7THN8_9APHY|nr:hypothetical protein ONZ51_g11396 [Trametes cubensis]